MAIGQRLINPVMEKEFRLRMRTIRSPLALMFYVLAIGVLALGFIYMEVQARVPRGLTPEDSRFLFYFLSGAQLVLISFMTPGLTAGVISGEREKQTLNILLTTQLSSSTIVLSKLFSSISFMLLVVFATLPVYSIVFLFGGISPGQLAAVFAFYVLVMVTLGSLGVLFSTLYKKTVVSVILTYGVTMFLYGFTGLAAIFVYEVFRGARFVSGFLLGFNPLAAMISIFEPDFGKEFFSGNLDGLQIWHLFVPVYAVITVVAVFFSIRRLRPVLKKRK